MRGSTRSVAVRSSANLFKSERSDYIASNYGASLSYDPRKRKTPERNERISYYEGDTESEDDYQGYDPEDTIIVKGPWSKKRKTLVLDNSSNDEPDEEIPYANVPVVKDEEPKRDGSAGKLFITLPTEVCATIFFDFSSVQCPSALRVARVGSAAVASTTDHSRTQC